MDNNQMMQVFKNEQFGEVRTLFKDGEPWFVGVDVCRALEIKNNRNAFARLDSDEKGVHSVDTPGGKQDLVIVNEPGLYRLILGSRRPEANTFKRWMLHDVVPAIRKTGGYIMGEEHMDDEEVMARALLIAHNKLAQLDKQVAKLREEAKIMAPKAEYCDMVLKAPNAVSISCIAKDYGMSAKAMNQKLKELGVQYRCGGMWLLYSKYQNKGYTKSETYTVKSTGKAVMRTKWTQDGRLGIYEILKKDGILPLMER